MPSRSAQKNGRFFSISWKSRQNDSKIKKKTKLALTVLAVLFLLLLLGQAVRFVHSLYTPMGIKESYGKVSSWDGTHNINLVVKLNSIFVLSYNPIEKKITVVDFPPQTYLSVPEGFGQWQVRSIYDLGQSSPTPIGARLLKGSVSSMLGIPIDGYLEFKNGFSNEHSSSTNEHSSSSNGTSKEAINLLRQNPLYLHSVWSNIQSDLTPIELLLLMKGLSQVRFDRFKYLDLKALNLLTEANLPDSTTVYEPDLIKIDSISQNFQEQGIAGEYLSVAIFNGTNYPGLAQKAARIITNLGGNVIITANTIEKFEQSVVLGDESQTKKRLNQIFSLDCKISPDCDKLLQTAQAEVSSSRAQINIILGEDFYQRYP